MKKFITLTLVTILGACAGRAPQNIQTTMPQDVNSTCDMIRAEIQANNVKVQELASEQGVKVAQNIATGVGGLIIWPLWFGMDFQGSAGKDLAALESRQQFLASLGASRCKGRKGV